GDSHEASTGADGHQRLSRRDRRRLRMIEKRDERRRDRSDRPAGTAAHGSEHSAGAGEVSQAEGSTEISARPERQPSIGRDARHDRESRSAGRDDRDSRSAGRGDRGDRGGRDGRPDRNGRSDRDGKSDAESRSDRFRGKNSSPATLISEVLKEGQEVLVQIAKEPLGQKGARITSHIALPGRYVVYMPTVEHVGVSRKVGTDQERLRLRKILQSGREGMPGGFICRTAAEGRSEAEIHADMEFLNTLWQEIKAKADRKNPPALVHHDLDIVQRVLRDQLTEEFKTIWVDNEELYERILRFVQSFQPSLVSRVRLYTKPAPIFDTFNVTTELEKALKPKVWLKSGGYIVINQTEALVAIDVNTGKFVGKSNRLEDTIVKTNLEAVKEAVRQIRLRDLGGIIVVDFIDMDERRNRQKVMQALDEEMKEDRAPYKILQFNDFGLVAITRKRVKQSLERTLCQPCPYCEGSGYIKNVQTVIGEILTEAQKIASAVEGEVSLRVNPEVGKVLKSHTNNYLEELEEILKAPVIVTSDPLLHQEKFDLA
ncbi:MAG: Rne/Rng family ribonuclease, partial [Bryobacterales bacterium]|nr:Rne/Rng family ribonuclease [Bryobacterales bacterium]